VSRNGVFHLANLVEFGETEQDFHIAEDPRTGKTYITWPDGLYLAETTHCSAFDRDWKAFKRQGS